jgi:tripartite-type tricarboxylate transporter receptor subunit TctC
MGHRIRAKLALALIAAMALSPARAQQSVEDFYRGKTITLMVPTSPGGINDISGRLVARHIGKFIPGNPNVVVQNQPGGGGLVAANKLANTIEKDGLTISILQRGTPQVAIEGNRNARFDPMQLTWLGSLSSYATDRYLLVVNKDFYARSAADLRKPGAALKLGGDQPGSTNLTFAFMSKVALGLNIDIVRGYPGAANMFLAMQNGELDGQVIGFNSLRAGQPALWEKKAVRPLVQFGSPTRLPELADVPTGDELAIDESMKEALLFAELPFRMALPFLAPPGLPPDRAKALQTAFMAMTKDGAFLADAKKINIDISAIDGAAVRDVIAQMKATPKDVVARYKEIEAVARKK